MTVEYVAVVHAPRQVRMVVVERSARARTAAIARYVRRAAEDQLAPPNRDVVRCLLDRGAVADAVDVYFTAVREDWDDEWLHEEMRVRR